MSDKITHTPSEAGGKFKIALMQAAMRQQKQNVGESFSTGFNTNRTPRDANISMSSMPNVTYLTTPTTMKPSPENVSRSPDHVPLSHSPLTVSIEQDEDVLRENRGPTPRFQSPLPTSLRAMSSTATLNRAPLMTQRQTILPTVHELVEQNPDVEDLDTAVTDIVKDLRLEAQGQAISSYRRSVLFKFVDSVVRVMVVIMGIVVGVLGNNAYRGSTSSSIALAVTIIGFTIPGLTELREQFSFKERSVVLRKCYQEFTKADQDLRILLVSGKSPEDMLIEIIKIENTLNEIDMDAFNSQIVKDRGPHEFNSVSKTTPPSPSVVVVRPEDIPVLQKTNPLTDFPEVRVQ